MCIAQVYGNGGKDSLKLPYLHEMDTTLQAVISKEPETRQTVFVRNYQQ